MQFTITKEGESALNLLANQQVHPDVLRNREQFIEAVRTMDESRHRTNTYYDVNEPGEVYAHAPGCGMCVNGVGLVGLGIDGFGNAIETELDRLAISLGVDKSLIKEIDRLNFKHPTFAQMANFLQQELHLYTDWLTAVQSPPFIFDASRLE